MASETLHWTGFNCIFPTENNTYMFVDNFKSSLVDESEQFGVSQGSILGTHVSRKQNDGNKVWNLTEK